MPKLQKLASIIWIEDCTNRVFYEKLDCLRSTYESHEILKKKTEQKLGVAGM